ncbi:unnamed protein product [Brassica rapa subsp. narinosa]
MNHIVLGGPTAGGEMMTRRRTDPNSWCGRGRRHRLFS